MLWEILNSIGFKFAQNLMTQCIIFFFPVETDISSIFLLIAILKMDVLFSNLVSVSDTGGINRFQHFEITHQYSLKCSTVRDKFQKVPSLSSPAWS